MKKVLRSLVATLAIALTLFGVQPSTALCLVDHAPVAEQSDDPHACCKDDEAKGEEACACAPGLDIAELAPPEVPPLRLMARQPVTPLPVVPVKTRLVRDAVVLRAPRGPPDRAAPIPPPQPLFQANCTYLI